jgi:hypothetical protein
VGGALDHGLLEGVRVLPKLSPTAASGGGGKNDGLGWICEAGMDAVERNSPEIYSCRAMTDVSVSTVEKETAAPYLLLCRCESGHCTKSF